MAAVARARREVEMRLVMAGILPLRAGPPRPSSVFSRVLCWLRMR